MSDWGTVITAIETEVRTAIGAMPAGALGFEQGIRPGTDLRDGELPHCFAHDPTETNTESDWQQIETRGSVQLDIWTRGATQETVNTYLDSIRDEIAGNPTLGGAVDFAWCSTRATVEAAFTGRQERAGVIVVQWRVGPK